MLVDMGCIDLDLDVAVRGSQGVEVSGLGPGRGRTANEVEHPTLALDPHYFGC